MSCTATETLIAGMLPIGSHAEGMAHWRNAWVPAMLEALTTADERLQANVSVYGLPVPLSMDSGSLVVLLQHILDPAFAAPAPGASKDGQVRATHWLVFLFACSLLKR